MFKERAFTLQYLYVLFNFNYADNNILIILIIINVTLTVVKMYPVFMMCQKTCYTLL